MTPLSLRHHYTRPRPIPNTLRAALAMPGRAILLAILFVASLPSRLRAHIGPCHWSDIVGSLVILPLALLFVVLLGIGEQQVLGWLQLLP
jgi:hypothetical protein